MRRVTLILLSLLLAVGFTTTAQAKKFSLTEGSGGQNHIGNGLPLPVQTPAGPGTTNTMFPNLKVPKRPGFVTVTGTTAKPLLSVGGKVGYQRKLVVPPNALVKEASQNTVGLKFSNPTVFAVGSNLKYEWPIAQATFSTGNVPVTPTIAGFGGTMTYSNALGARFGGPASFRFSSGGASGLIAAPVTVYIKINATTPACTHPAFGGTDAGCVAGILPAVVAGVATFGVGGNTMTTVTTPGGAVPGNNIAAVQMGLSPLGTIVNAALVASNPGLPTNMATSQPGPWTTGQVIINNPAAGGAGELFTLSGRDDRTANGGGTIQLVAGALSNRTASGPNANRGWVRLRLAPFDDVVPAMPWWGLAATGSLMLLSFGYVTRQRFFGQR